MWRSWGLQEHDRDDVLAEAIESLWRNHHRYDPRKGTVRAYFSTIVCNGAKDLAARLGKRRIAFVDLDLMASVVEPPGEAREHHRVVAQRDLGRADRGVGGSAEERADDRKHTNQQDGIFRRVETRMNFCQKAPDLAAAGLH